jgi:hypothetical protein
VPAGILPMPSGNISPSPKSHIVFKIVFPLDRVVSTNSVEPPWQTFLYLKFASGLGLTLIVIVLVILSQASLACVT